MLAAAPCYLKSTFQGEYVFDHAWADAYERAGGSYYPKLQVAVPFTPVTGPRLLVADGPERAAARRLLAPACEALREQTDASSIHVTFLAARTRSASAGDGFLTRNDQPVPLVNEGYGSFDDFLGALSSRKRKAIRRERRDALAGGVTIDWAHRRAT